MSLIVASSEDETGRCIVITPPIVCGSQKKGLGETGWETCLSGCNPYPRQSLYHTSFALANARSLGDRCGAGRLVAPVAVWSRVVTAPVASPGNTGMMPSSVQREENAFFPPSTPQPEHEDADPLSYALAHHSAEPVKLHAPDPCPLVVRCLRSCSYPQHPRRLAPVHMMKMPLLQ